MQLSSPSVRRSKGRGFGLIVCLGAAAALTDCGARTELFVPVPTPEVCVVSATPPGTMHACDGGSTTLTGTVFDPAGKHPLYNVVVYVPSSTPAPFTAGASCDSCNSLYSGNPIATALTGADGTFTLTGVPDGDNIPLVIQVGKWRRQFKLPHVTPCAINALPMESLLLPKNASEGDLPNIAVSTGGADTLECIFLRMGVDPAEYVGGSGGPGHIHIFQGATNPNGPGPGAAPGSGMIHVAPNTQPPGPRSYQALWDSDSDIMPYDMVFLSCEGSETTNMNQEVLFDYASAGGRVYASHYHYAWFDSGPFGKTNVATWVPGSDNMGNISATIVTTTASGANFPQGTALASWLGTTGALTNGELPIVQARHNADLSASNTDSQAWIVANQNASPAGAVQYFSFNTPVGAAPASQCGEVVYTDIHVGAASSDNPSLPVPSECANVDLSPQETALEFVLYNLSACVTQPGQAPTAPPACVPSVGDAE